MYLPLKDYRAYAIGNNITEQMNNGIDPDIEMKLNYINLLSGEVESFDVGEWEIYMDTLKYKFDNREDKIIFEGKLPSISDFKPMIDFIDLSDADKKNWYIDSLIKADYDFFYEEKMVVSSIYGSDTMPAVDYDTLYYPDSMYTAGPPFLALTDDGAPFDLDMTPFIKRGDYVLLMTIRDMESINEAAMPDLKLILDGAKENNIPFYVVTPAVQEEIDLLKAKFDFDATFLAIDGTEVKIIIRSNPGLVLIKKGTILDKWPSRSIPDFDSIFEDYIQGK